MIKVAIVEDHQPLRNSVEAGYNRTWGMRCVAALPNLLNVVSDLSKEEPHIVLMGH